MESIFKTSIDGIIEEAFEKIGRDAQKSKEQVEYDIHIAKFSLMAIANSFEMGLKKNDMNLILAGVSALSEFHKMKMSEIAYHAFLSMLPGAKKFKPFDEINHPPKQKNPWLLWKPDAVIALEQFNGQQVVFITRQNVFIYGKVSKNTEGMYNILTQDKDGQFIVYWEEDVKAICLQSEFEKSNFTILEYYGI